MERQPERGSGSAGLRNVSRNAGDVRQNCRTPAAFREMGNFPPEGQPGNKGNASQPRTPHAGGAADDSRGEGSTHLLETVVQIEPTPAVRMGIAG